MAQVFTKEDPGVTEGVTPSADQIPDLYGATTVTNIDSKHIMATFPIGSTDLTLSDTSVEDSGTKLYSSYTDTITESTQFPMQHATQHLPNKTVSLTTTDYSVDSLISSVSAISASTQDSMDATSGSVDSLSSSISSSTKAPYEGHTDSQISSIISSIVSSSSSSSSIAPSAAGASDYSAKDLLNNDTPDIYSSYEPSVSESNSATEILSSITSNVLLFTSTDSNQNVSKHVLDSSKEMYINISPSVDYVPSTGELYSPVTASKTVFSTSEVPVDSSTFKSTPIVPFTPSGKPVNTVDPGSTALFGGGLTDYILYIGVPVCGFVIILFLIVCLVCLKKRKNKHQGSPTKNHVQDLWVNSQQEIPLTTQETLREANGGETIGGRQDLVLRRRKKTGRIKIKGKNALGMISQAFDSDEIEESVPVSPPLPWEFSKEVNDSERVLEKSDLIGSDALSDLDTVLHDLDDILEFEDDVSDTNVGENLDNIYLDTALHDLDDILECEDDVSDTNVGENLDNVYLDTALHDLDDILECEDDGCDSNVGENLDNVDLEANLDELNNDMDSEEGTITGGEDNEASELSDDELVPEGCTTYEAVFDFQAELETHLTLKRGDLVRVHRKEGNGWWRGTVGENTGWFPNSYVQAAPQDKLETEDEIEMHSESNVSSFMVQPRHTPSFRDSLSIPSEKDIEAEPLYCKIQPKEKRKSLPNVPDKSPPKLTVPSRENTTTPIEDGSKYIAIYSYGGHFTGELTINKGDIIQGKELDRNGWMKGYNETTNQEGWCPTQYVDRLDKDEVKQLGVGSCSVPNSGSQNSLSPDPLTYKQLEANKNIDGIKDWVGIVHKAVHSYSAEKAGDLEFEEGDLVTVFQVLENGWWLGSKDNVVGWFPGSYVKMIPQPSPRLPCQRSASSPCYSSPTSESPVSSDESKSVTDEGSDVTPTKPSKIRPVRKAPPPPVRLDKPNNSSLSPPKSTEGSDSKIPPITLNKANKSPQPIRAAPPVPPGQVDPRDHSPLYEAIGNDKVEHISGPALIKTTMNDGLYDLIQPTASEDKKKQKEKVKPEVPKRYIKPKLVKVPRSEINIPISAPPNGSPRGSGIARPTAPPPPRPVGPPKVPEGFSKTDKDRSNSEDHDQSEESLFFHLPPQSILDGIPRQESFEPESDVSPYKSMSSFGSTFGKQEKKLENNNISLNSHKNELETSHSYLESFDQSDLDKLKDGSKKSNMAENVSSQEAVQEAEDSLKNENSHESDFSRRDRGEAKIDEEKNVQKKQKSGSRIPPPKHITLSNIDNGIPVLDAEANDTKGSDKAIPKQSRIPMTRKDSPAKHVDLKKSALNETYNIGVKEVDKALQEKETEISESAVIDFTDLTETKKTKASQKEVVKDDNLDEHMRSRSESFNKPPVAPKPKSKGLPKLLPKSASGSNSPDEPGEVDDDVDDQFEQYKTDTQVCEESDQKLYDNNESKNKDPQRVSKLPKIAQKSPKLKKSGIPASPLMRVKNAEKQPKQSRKQNLSESDSDAPLSPTANQKNKQESPAMARRGTPKQIPNSEKSIRNRSNSPHGRTGIPTSLRQRSSSPSSKLPKATSSPSPGSPSPTMAPSSIPKPSGLVQPKRIQTPKGSHSPGSEPSSSASTNQSPDTSFENTDEDQDIQATSPRPDRPSKPPRVVKQKSQDGKPPKHGRSLLPVIHKTMDATNGMSQGNKPKSGIPVSKPGGKQQDSKVSPEDMGNRGPTLFRAVRGYTAQTDEELSFTEGTFVTELSDCDRVGWFVGMLADGTTGLYPADYFKSSLVGSQSEA